jgi:hypothetical protein
MLGDKNILIEWHSLYKSAAATGKRISVHFLKYSLKFSALEMEAKRYIGMGNN